MLKAVYTYPKNYILPLLAGRGRGWSLLLLRYLLPSPLREGLGVGLLLAACSPEPPLHLYDAQEVELNQPIIDLELDVYWDYELAFGIEYDWKLEWFYGWDDEDRRLWGELGYTAPTIFNLRRYYTGDEPKAPHTGVISNTIEGTHFQERFDWGYWDILVWNQITTLDGVQSLIFDEQTTLDSVVAFTNMSMHPSRYQAPQYTRAFYAPEPLFTAYDEDVQVDRKLTGFTFDPERNVWFKQLSMVMRPITYIYLTQVILHNNRGRVTAIDGSANLSAMARTTTLNSGRAGDDAITVNYDVRMKRNVNLTPYSYEEEAQPAQSPIAPKKPKKPIKLINPKDPITPAASRKASTEVVDIIGGRLMTFGIPGHQANVISRADEVSDRYRHYLDVDMIFNNGKDSTLVFDVTDQVRKRYKGGVITVELDMDTVPIPNRRGGSGFNAVVLEPDTITHVIEM